MKISKILSLLALTVSVSHATPSLETLKSHFQRPKDVPYPNDNKWTEEKAKLGKLLFFDPRISKAKNLSCVSCHHPGMGWEIGTPKAIGTGGIAEPMGRKAQTLHNLAWSDAYFWDGRADSLEDQILVAIAGPKAMGLEHDEMLRRIQAIKGYDLPYKQAFPKQKLLKENIAKAIATYVRSLRSPDTPFDRWVSGDEKAISENAKKGFALFNAKARCVLCHSGWNFTDNAYHDIGLVGADIGRGKLFPKVVAMQFALKTPTLRDVGRRMPYFHDGSSANLEEVIDLYNKGSAVKRPSLSVDIKPLELSNKEKKNLKEFLESLSSEQNSIIIPDMVF